jgi:hypothetical protein
VIPVPTPPKTGGGGTFHLVGAPSSSVGVNRVGGAPIMLPRTGGGGTPGDPTAPLAPLAMLAALAIAAGRFLPRLIKK